MLGWVEVPTDNDVQSFQSRFLFRRRENKLASFFQLKSRVVMHGLYKKKTGAKQAAAVATPEYVRPVIANAAKNRMFHHIVGMKTAHLQARTNEDGPPLFVIPPVGIKCTGVQSKLV